MSNTMQTTTPTSKALWPQHMSSADAIAQSPDIFKRTTSEESERVTKKRTSLSAVNRILWTAGGSLEVDYLGVLGSTWQKSFFL